MNKDTPIILITLAITNADLKAAHALAQALGDDECENSLLQVSPFTEDVLIGFTTRLFERVREMGLFAEDEGAGVCLIAGTIYRQAGRKGAHPVDSVAQSNGDRRV